MDKVIDLTGLAAVKAYIDDKGKTVTQGNWRYRINSDGTFEAWFGATKQTVTITDTSGNVYRSERMTLTLPTGLTSQGATSILSFNVGAGHNNYPTWTAVASKTETQLNYYVLSGGSRSQNSNYTIAAYVFGTID